MAKKANNKERDKAAKEMQKYIRVKRCLEATGLAFVGHCVTHGTHRYHISYLEAGHFMGGRRNAVLFDVMGIYNQCGHCNRTNHGEHKKYRKFLVKKHGEEWVLNRERRAKRTIPNVQIDFKKLRAGIKRMTEKMYHKYGYKTFYEILHS